MLPRKLLWPFLLAPLAACATQTEFDRRAAAWIGRPEGDLVASLGIPDKTYTADGRRFVEYEKRRILPGDPPLYAGPFGGFGSRFGYGGWGYGGWGYGGFYGGFPPRLLACDLTFELRGDRVVNFTHRGNDCVATPGSAAGGTLGSAT